MAVFQNARPRREKKPGLHMGGRGQLEKLEEGRGGTHATLLQNRVGSRS